MKALLSGATWLRLSYKYLKSYIEWWPLRVLNRHIAGINISEVNARYLEANGVSRPEWLAALNANLGQSWTGMYATGLRNGCDKWVVATAPDGRILGRIELNKFKQMFGRSALAEATSKGVVRGDN